MTIERGVAWGKTVQVPDNIVSVATDSALADCSPADFISLLGGDLFQSLGSPHPVRTGSERTLVNIDALECQLEVSGTNQKLLAASSVVIGSWWSRAEFVCITNGGMLNGLDLTPRAHPNDGKWDVLAIQKSMNLKQRILARRRSKTGSHIPHPDISITRMAEMSFHRAHKRQKLVIDGVPQPQWSSVHCHVVPDYWQVVL
jgi:hypothetical protein